uniref:Uncharacterized protein n=1 Tax=Nelumbo nucifera TaxID=4432 RepID=A0A822YJR6_NELNU|nr:TPA_asm: hypothetical protein HUJ06_011583 [Nelumbo nucifera]
MTQGERFGCGSWENQPLYVFSLPHLVDLVRKGKKCKKEHGLI